MKRSAMMLGVLILLAACATSSQSPKKEIVLHAHDVGDNPAAEIDTDNTLVCEYTPVAGSHFQRKVCMNHRDREAARQQLMNELGPQHHGFRAN